MDTVAQVVRITNIILCLSYLPLLFARIKYEERKDSVWAITGGGFICMGIAQSSFANINTRVPLRPGAFVVLVGLIILIAGGTLSLRAAVCRVPAERDDAEAKRDRAE